MDDRAVWSVGSAALLYLLDEGLRETIAGAEFHVAQDRLVRRRAEVVILEVAVPVFVDQISAFGTSRFRDENAGERQAGGVVLHELHVFQGGARLIRQRHTIARLNAGVGGEGKNPPATSGAKDHALRCDGLNSARHQLQGNHALYPALIYQEPGYKPFVVAGDGLVFECGLKKGMQEVEPGLIGGKPGAHFLHAAERPDRNASIRISAPGAEIRMDALRDRKSTRLNSSHAHISYAVF